MWKVVALIPAFLAFASTSTHANVPPAAPVILEPAAGAAGLNPADIHMATAGFSDTDAGDLHRCSDWQIVSKSDGQVVWSAPCASGAASVHIHLGDGTFHTAPELSHDAEYVLRVRHADDSQDDATSWSEWSEREFGTGPPSTIHPMLIAAVMREPVPVWVDGAGDQIVLSSEGDDSAYLQIARTDGVVLARISDTTLVEDPSGAKEHQPVRIEVVAADQPLSVVEGYVEFFDENLSRRQVWLPAMTLAPGERAAFWVASDGSSYVAAPDSGEPDFRTLARGAPVPWISPDPALRIERIAGGFQLPVALAFAPQPGEAPHAPWLYVAELYGTIKVISRDGEVSTYASDLLGFDGQGPFPGTGEQGIGGMVADPLSGDLFVTLPQAVGDQLIPRVIRLSSEDGGRTAAGQQLVLELPDIAHVASHQISNISIGPDRKLYVHIGDGHSAHLARDPDSFLGKILRLEMDGTPAVDNPLYDSSDGISARDYVYAVGMRNPFGGAWRARTNTLYAVGNGPTTDRIFEVRSGADYGWDGTDESMQQGAIHTWNPPAAPVRLDFLQEETFGGSGFGDDWMDSILVTESGSTWAEGPQREGKRVTLFRFEEDGSLGPAEPLAIYQGSGRATAAALAAGPDGIYFSDLYRDQGATTPFDAGASVLRIRWAGTAGFALRTTEDPLTIEVEDRSTVRDPETWVWRFGGERIEGGPSQRHTFSAEGVHRVRLRVSGDAGDLVAGTSVLVGSAGGTGLRGEYFAPGQEKPVVTRIDPQIDFSWEKAPHAGLPVAGYRVRWIGVITARLTGLHSFEAETADRVRLWIGGDQVITDWPPSDPGRAGTVYLQAGKTYSFRLEYFQSSTDPGIRLFWSSRFHERELIPQDLLSPESIHPRRGVRPPRGK